MRGYEKLAADIVKHAIIDYRKACEGLTQLEARGALLRLTNRSKYEKIRAKYNQEIEEIESFIQSPYFGILTSINPETLLITLREECKYNGCKKVLKSG
jgi:hypothetical protein